MSNAVNERLRTLAEHYRAEAATCCQFAATAHNLHDRDAWLQLAERWIKVAEEAEGRWLEIDGQTERGSLLKFAQGCLRPIARTTVRLWPLRYRAH